MLADPRVGLLGADGLPVATAAIDVADVTEVVVLDDDDEDRDATSPLVEETVIVCCGGTSMQFRHTHAAENALCEPPTITTAFFFTALGTIPAC